MNNWDRTIAQSKRVAQADYRKSDIKDELDDKVAAIWARAESGEITEKEAKALVWETELDYDHVWK